MFYPVTRLGRLRKSQAIRNMVQETQLNVRSLISPVFVVEGKNKKEPIKCLPDNFRVSVDILLKEAKEIIDLHIPAVILFGIAERKDERASSAYAKNGLIQTAVKVLKDKYPNLVVITDVCLCAYTNSGHCGIIKGKVAVNKNGSENEESLLTQPANQELVIYNDASLEILAKIALSHAEAGADIIAPSSMLDGQVMAIRKSLDTNNFKHIPIMSYSVKYASNFYDPFRDAVQCAPEFGDTKTYQMDIANAKEAIREIELDIHEGADIIMVKPALCYLDIIAKAKQHFNLPLAAFNVSGEFSMVKAVSSMGWLAEKGIVLEILTSIKRAGADLIISYHAKDVARWLSGKYLL